MIDFVATVVDPFGQRASRNFSVATDPSIPSFRLFADLGVDPNENISDGFQNPGSFSQAIGRLTPPFEIVVDGMFRIDNTLFLPSGCRFRGLGTGTGFRRYTQSLVPTGWNTRIQPWFAYLQPESNVVITDLEVVGPLASALYDQNRETAHGITFSGGITNCTVSRVSITGVHGDFLYFSKNFPTDHLFEDVIGTFAGRQMIGLGGGSRLTFRRILMQDGARTGIDFEQIRDMSEDVLFEDSSFLRLRNYCFGAHAATVKRLTFRRVVFDGGVALGLLKATSDTTGVYGPHEDWTLENVIYRGQNSRGNGNFTVTGLRNLQINDSSFALKHQASIVGSTGTIARTSATTVTGQIPAVCAGPEMSIINCQGVGNCG